MMWIITSILKKCEVMDGALIGPIIKWTVLSTFWDSLWWPNAAHFGDAFHQDNNRTGVATKLKNLIKDLLHSS